MIGARLDRNCRRSVRLSPSSSRKRSTGDLSGGGGGNGGGNVSAILSSGAGTWAGKVAHNRPATPATVRTAALRKYFRPAKLMESLVQRQELFIRRRRVQLENGF